MLNSSQVMYVSYLGVCEGMKDRQWDCVETKTQKKTAVSGEWMCHGDAEALQSDLFEQLWRFFVQI